MLYPMFYFFIVDVKCSFIIYTYVNLHKFPIVVNLHFVSRKITDRFIDRFPVIEQNLALLWLQINFPLGTFDCLIDIDFLL
jgi:hypothetical protein